MSGTSAGDPLVAPLPAEVPLRSAPLVRVIVQVRFPEILTIEQRDYVAPFQESIRKTYPILRTEHSQGLLLGPGGAAMSARPLTTWRFTDPEGTWRTSLAPTFVALETTRYTSRADFLGRLGTVVAALQKHIDPAQVDRVGVRYIDRVTGPAVTSLADLVRPEVRGLVGTPAEGHLAHSITESLFSAGDTERLLTRWGYLPEDATFDPAALEPVPERSWILDLDMFSTRPMPFAPEGIVSTATRYAERIYTVFRWAVTPAFLARFGGQS